MTGIVRQLRANRLFMRQQVEVDHVYIMQLTK